MLDMPKSVDGGGGFADCMSTLFLQGLCVELRLLRRRWRLKKSATVGGLIEGMPASLQTAITKAVKGLPTE